MLNSFVPLNHVLSHEQASRPLVRSEYGQGKKEDYSNVAAIGLCSVRIHQQILILI